MSTSERGQDPNFTFCEDGKRPYVTSYLQRPNLRVGDKVYLLNANGFREGPYVIASLPRVGKCTLSLENGTAVRNGQEIETDFVEAE